MTDPDLLRSRIEAVYQTACREESPYGALSWFARQAHVDPRTVARWVQGDRDPTGPAVAVLELLEERYGLD